MHLSTAVCDRTRLGPYEIRVQFGFPNQVLGSGQTGVNSATANSPRQIQFGLKLLF